MKRNALRVLFALMALPLFVACPFTFEGDDSEQEMLLLPLESLEISGSYKDNYGGQHKIQATRVVAGVMGYWNSEDSSSSTQATIVDFSNQLRTVYTRTGVPDWCTGQGTAFPQCECYNTGLCYNRNVWTIDSGDIYYCQIVYNKPTLAEAIADPATANPDDPDTTGCGGTFAWSKLSPL